MVLKYARGMVYWATTPNHGDNHTIQGRRPVVIISNDVGNHYSSNVTVLPCTTNIEHHQPTRVHTTLVDNKPSAIMCETSMTIDKQNLGEFLGVLDKTTMECVDEALKKAFNLSGDVEWTRK